MLDFFRDIYLEAKGIDCNQAQLERIKRKKEKEQNKIILSSGVKTLIYILGVLFLISGVGTFPFIFKWGNWFYIIRNTIQIILDVAILICVSIHKKKTEIIAIVLIGIFIMLQYSSWLLMLEAG